MNSILEIVVVGVVVAAACVFVGVKLVSALRGKQASCCSEGAGASKAATCGGCTGCGQEIGAQSR